jgi:TRAP-type C4-dicarboxylate transport system substrate-binding protein
MLIVNGKFYEGLPVEIKKAIAEGGEESSKWLMGVTIKSEGDYFDKLKESGVTITNPNMGPIREAVKPIYKEYGEKLKAVELIEQISKIQ